MAFTSAWSQLKSRFLKLECWQRYWEAEDNRSQAAYDRGDLDTAGDLLRAEAEADRPLYQDVRTRGIEYARVRLLQEPLTPYLKYELLSYRIRVDLGENIEVVRCNDAAHLPDERHFDFLLFDQTTALIHDYGTAEVGQQTGGWLTRDSEVITRLEQTVADLRQQAVPLHQYLART
ncbi:DUF6879 family protein [Actinoplanes sp. NPDC051851]|uniref:DUF6879 family protein n=1 Tax=Actinoplanes sp. NPDC051851 TaxID=3154753 RepID=UPI0034184E3F